ncbi:Platinum sensitivity protein [Mortierella sp. AM989]|nr:Platinum sensitivity protein [Mortierella sp. AM989]
MESQAKMRVKVYRLGTGNEWIDQGTGHCSCEFNEDKSEGTLVVYSEQEENKVLLQSKIKTGDDVYQRQQADDLFSDPVDIGDIATTEYITLPDPDISNLKEIHDLIKVRLHEILVIQHILKDEVFFNCIGMLEYDPEAEDKKIADFRGLLAKRSKFKQIIPIKNQDTEQRIHQVFRLQFLRDTVLSRFMDEGLSSIFASLIFFNNIDIVGAIHKDRPFLKDLFEILDNDLEPLDRKRDVVRFVQQFCSIARSTQFAVRVGLYR